jgi:hypothetical protein
MGADATTTPAPAAAGTSRSRLPTHPRKLTPELLSTVISTLHPGARVEAVELVEWVGIDDDLVSTTGRGKLRLSYADNSQGLPERVLAKMIVDEKSIAPACMYETEVNIHRRMLPGLTLERPLCLAAEYEPDTDNFLLLLEDVSVRGARFTNVLQPPLTPDEVGMLLDWLAELHARFWQSPRLDQEKGWLSSQVSGRQFEMFNAGDWLVALMDANVAESPYRADFVARAGRSPAQLWALVKAVHRHQAKSLPMTLCHGDTGAHNTYRLPDGRGGFVDWQLSVKAAWSHDVHYLVCTGLSVRDRRVHETALVQRYLDRLQALGVVYRPSLDQAMAEYSLAMMWGLVIGWFSVPASMYGMDIISANIERLFAAVCDHDVLARAEGLL